MIEPELGRDGKRLAGAQLLGCGRRIFSSIPI
jgi:hypothetical protein